jgi:hypothetical protein
MESAFGAEAPPEGEVRRAGQVGDRGEVVGDDASGYNSPADGRDNAEAEWDGAGGNGRPRRKRPRPVQGTPRRPSRSAAAAKDSRVGWNRVDPVGQRGDSAPEDRSASWPRGDARSPFRGEADFASDEALETAEAVTVSRDLGEPPAADAARIPGRSASRRGAQRMAPAPAENWSVAANPPPSTTDAVWTAAERQQFATRGRVASVIATAVSTKSSASDPSTRKCP